MCKTETKSEKKGVSLHTMMKITKGKMDKFVCNDEAVIDLSSINEQIRIHGGIHVGKTFKNARKQ